MILANGLKKHVHWKAQNCIKYGINRAKEATHIVKNNFDIYNKTINPYVDINFIKTLLKHDNIDTTIEYIPAYKPIEQLITTYGIKIQWIQ